MEPPLASFLESPRCPPHSGLGERIVILKAKQPESIIHHSAEKSSQTHLAVYI